MEELNEPSGAVAQRFQDGLQPYYSRLNRSIEAAKKHGYPVAKVCRLVYWHYLVDVLGTSADAHRAELDKAMTYFEQDRTDMQSSRETIEWFGLAPLLTLDVAADFLSGEEPGDQYRKDQLLADVVRQASTRTDASSLHTECVFTESAVDEGSPCGCRHNAVCPAKTAGYLLLQGHIDAAPYDAQEHDLRPLATYRDMHVRFALAERLGLVELSLIDHLREAYHEWWLQQPGYLDAEA